jgi:hypothetical protein
LGTEETGASTFVLPAGDNVSTAGEPAGMDAGIFRSGLQSDKRLTLTLRPVIERAPLCPGQYSLRLWMLDPTSTAAGQRVFEVSVSNDGQRRTEASHPRAAADHAAARDRVDIFKEVGQAKRVLVRSYPVSLTPGEEVEVTLTPLVGKATLLAVVLEPSEANGHDSRRVGKDIGFSN